MTDLLTPIPDDVRHEVTADAALILDHVLDLRETPPMDDDRLVDLDDDGWDRT